MSNGDGGDDDYPDSYTYPLDPGGRTGRVGVIEGRAYESNAATHLLWNVREGDVLDVETWGSSTPDPTVTIVAYNIEPVGETDSGKQYRLWPRYSPKDSLDPPTAWLREEETNDSAGEIKTLYVREKADGD